MFLSLKKKKKDLTVFTTDSFLIVTSVPHTCYFRSIKDCLLFFPVSVFLSRRVSHFLLKFPFSFPGMCFIFEEDASFIPTTL